MDDDFDEHDAHSGPERRKSRDRQTPKDRKPRQWVTFDEFGELVPLTETQLVRLRERATNLCVWHLGQGPRTRKQLLDVMAKKGVPDDMALSVLEKMEEYNYVNDAAYADNFVRSRHTTHRKGASAIRYELIRKGVDSETIAAAMEQVDPDSERANAVVLVEKKLRSTQHLERRKRTNRLVSMLARKGYSPGVAYEVVREVLDAEGADSDDTDD